MTSENYGELAKKLKERPVSDETANSAAAAFERIATARAKKVEKREAQKADATSLFKE